MKKNEDFVRYTPYAVVTGAAGGMGRIYALRLAQRGYNLILADINPSGLDQTEAVVNEETGDSHPDIIKMPMDLAEKDAAQKIHEMAVAKNCIVDVLVNNAGIFFFNELTEVSERKISTMMMLHTYTPVMLCRAFLPEMKERGRGYILNVSSLGAWMPWPGVGMYGNTKNFMRGFSRMLRIEAKDSGVSVTTAFFGAVDTPLYPLKPNLRKLARSLHVMIPPEVAVDKALKALFKGRKRLMPGVINYIFRFFMRIVPDCILAFALKQVRKIWAKNAKN